MSDEDKTSRDPDAAPKPAKTEREDRLAAQLRANLQRRKAQARARKASDDGQQ
ncbi:hypothetical protein [Pontivivens ytuae]|uniref:Uncharacterized protein n=1 Tax=Pontivivens ytuae TaxID=2789856 RepID=A0A7S9LQU6_9RHOB|nr:hypothetical protein [Pontivivens ytuae]QPH53305.1 hypothetical protein I0K15_16155 [Pontivivens ytuae]